LRVLSKEDSLDQRHTVELTTRELLSIYAVSGRIAGAGPVRKTLGEMRSAIDRALGLNRPMFAVVDERLGDHISGIIYTKSGGTDKEDC
jgi:hypothetical protein